MSEAFKKYILAENSETPETSEFQAVEGEASEPGAEGEDSPWADALFPLLALAVAAYLAKWWWDDFCAQKRGESVKGALPGATPCGGLALGIAAAGALVLLAAQVGGEYALGIVAEQSTIAWLFLVQMIAAAVWEEVIFRGFLVVESKGRAALLGSIVAVSLLFALGHPHLWSLEFAEGVSSWTFWEGDLDFHFTTKAIFSTGWLFAMSLWFYAMRFAPFNPRRSLLPCVAAHLVYNLGVFFTKLAQGHVEGLF
jgi:membrane protease YdiL (CAAX protease family)